MTDKERVQQPKLEKCAVCGKQATYITYYICMGCGAKYCSKNCEDAHRRSYDF